MTNATRILKRTIVAEWLLTGALIIAAAAEELPAPLRGAHGLEPMTAADMAGLLLVTLLAIAGFGAYRLKPWARTLYTASAALLLLVQLTSGPLVQGPITTTLHCLTDIAHGAVIALMFASEARKSFGS